MNVVLGENLAKYRKKAGYSQEELADKLGVSRQAVSKWERGEASPDTENLIALSRLYGVTLDELVNKEPSESETKTNEKKDDNRNYVNIGLDGIHVKDDEDEAHIDKCGIHINEGKEKIKKEFEKEFGGDKFYLAKKVSSSILYPLVIVTYLLLGFLLKNQNGWAIYWTLFFIPEIINSIIDCIHFKRLKHFNIVFTCCFVYLFLGMLLGIWHPTWIIFIAIPVFYSAIWPIDYHIARKERDKKLNENIVDATMDIK